MSGKVVIAYVCRMKKWMMLFSAILVFGCSAPKHGADAPPIEAELVDGSEFRLSGLKGKHVLVVFWGSWCGPCLRELPKVVALHQKHEGQLQVVSIALEKSGDRWKNTAERFGFSWEYQIVEQRPMVVASEYARAFGVSEIPAHFLISPEGKLLPDMDLKQVDEFLSAQ